MPVIVKVCNIKILEELEKIYLQNNIDYTINKFSNEKTLINLIPFLQNDKKNNDEKINFILLKRIGKTTKPNSFKISIKNIKKYCKAIAQY